MNPISHIKKIGARGWKTAILAFLREIWSRRIFDVVVWKFPGMPAKNESASEISFTLVSRESGTEWLASIAEVWPQELEQYRKGKLLGALAARIEKGQICIVGHCGPRVLGALWITQIPKEYRVLREEFGEEWRMLKSLFVTHEARGRGMGQSLLQFAVRCGNDAGWRGLVSLIMESRQSSMKAHLAVGFTKIGRLTSSWICFRHSLGFAAESLSQADNSKNH